MHTHLQISQDHEKVPWPIPSLRLLGKKNGAGAREGRQCEGQVPGMGWRGGGGRQQEAKCGGVKGMDQTA